MYLKLLYGHILSKMEKISLINAHTHSPQKRLFTRFPLYIEYILRYILYVWKKYISDFYIAKYFILPLSIINRYLTSVSYIFAMLL